MALTFNPETLDFDLPAELIAQEPLNDRSSARMMVLNRKNQSIENKTFKDLPSFLNSGDVLVLNETKVIPAKLRGKKKTGGRVEVIVEGEPSASPVRKALIRPSVKPGAELTLDGEAVIRVKDRTPDGDYEIEDLSGRLRELLQTTGQIPLPPYIKRDENDPRSKTDREDYQTVYSSVPGSIAAPTAGLHFDNPLLTALEKKGVEIKKIVLHVGWGTFKPILDKVDTHQMLGERFQVSSETMNSLRKAKKENRRIIGVGTTVTRTLESIPENQSGAYEGETRLFIQPGFTFRWLSGLITNFHVPRSTPIALASAFAGLSFLEKSYNEAVIHKYRFYSYGDGMLII